MKLELALLATDQMTKAGIRIAERSRQQQAGTGQSVLGASGD